MPVEPGAPGPGGMATSGGGGGGSATASSAAWWMLAGGAVAIGAAAAAGGAFALASHYLQGPGRGGSQDELEGARLSRCGGARYHRRASGALCTPYAAMCGGGCRCCVRNLNTPPQPRATLYLPSCAPTRPPLRSAPSLPLRRPPAAPQRLHHGQPHQQQRPAPPAVAGTHNARMPRPQVRGWAPAARRMRPCLHKWKTALSAAHGLRLTACGSRPAAHGLRFRMPGVRWHRSPLVCPADSRMPR